MRTHSSRPTRRPCSNPFMSKVLSLRQLSSWLSTLNLASNHVWDAHADPPPVRTVRTSVSKIHRRVLFRRCASDPFPLRPTPGTSFARPKPHRFTRVQVRNVQTKAWHKIRLAMRRYSTPSHLTSVVNQSLAKGHHSDNQSAIPESLFVHAPNATD